MQDTQAMNDSSSVFGLIPRPFKGIVLCATGVMDKVRGMNRIGRRHHTELHLAGHAADIIQTGDGAGRDVF